MHPLVLGYTDNKLLDDYFGRYFSDLRTFLSGKTDHTSLIPEFLLIPDISTTIEHIRRNPSDTERGLGFLSEEWEIFSAGGKDGMLSFQGDTIP